MKYNKGRFGNKKERRERKVEEPLQVPRWSKPAELREEENDIVEATHEESVTDTEELTDVTLNEAQGTEEVSENVDFTSESTDEAAAREASAVHTEAAEEAAVFKEEVLPYGQTCEKLPESTLSPELLPDVENETSLLSAAVAAGKIDINESEEFSLQEEALENVVSADEASEVEEETLEEDEAASENSVTNLMTTEDENSEENETDYALEVKEDTEAGEDTVVVPSGKPYRRTQTAVDKDEKHSVIYEILDWSKYILLALVLGLLITGYVVQRNEVVGVSMDPTLQNEDRVWVQKLSKLWGGINHGDIVTVHGAALSDGSLQQEDLVKRVIGMAGDRVEIRDGLVYLNGSLLPEPYLADGVQTYMPDLGTMDLTLKEGQYFVMGDNRGSSKDSRFFGPVTEDAILGEVWFRSSPFERMGFVH